jgi:hypothetical protein
MRFATPFYFAVVLVTDGAAGHGYPKQQFQNSVRRICPIMVYYTKTPNRLPNFRLIGKNPA